MTIPALTECQKALLWLMYFWQHRGFTQIARPAPNAFDYEVERSLRDLDGRPLGLHGFGLQVLLDEQHLMRTTWLWQWSTDAVRLASVDFPLLALPLESRFSQADVSDALHRLVTADGYIVRCVGGEDATKLRSVLIEPGLILSVGVPVCLTYRDHTYLVPGLTYWLSDEASTRRQLSLSEFEPWTIIDGIAHRGTDADSLEISRQAFRASKLPETVPPVVEVSIPKRGLLLPMSQLRIRCGSCASMLGHKLGVRLGSDACPKCNETFELCYAAQSRCMGRVDAPGDMVLLAANSFNLSNNGYLAARQLVEGDGYAPFAARRRCVFALENLQMSAIMDCLEALAQSPAWEVSDLPRCCTLDMLRTYDLRGWIELFSQSCGWVSPQRFPGAAGPLETMLKNRCRVRISETGRNALAEHRVLLAESADAPPAPPSSDRILINRESRRATFGGSVLDIDNHRQFDVLACLEAAPEFECSYTELEQVRSPDSVFDEVDLQSVPSDLAKCLFAINQALQRAGVPWRYASVPKRKAYARQDRPVRPAANGLGITSE